MKSFAQVLDLKDDPQIIEDYERMHQNVWPGVVRALRGIGIERMEIFRFRNRLFMYFTAPEDFDPKKDFQSYAESNGAAKWDELMRSFQQKLPNTPPDEWWSPAKQVFDSAWFDW